MERTITVGFSPCPNDTFIFEALVNGRINTYPFRFHPILADVEELNRMALEGLLDVTKISVAAYPFASAQYVILDSGSALGKGVGPLLVTSHSDPKSVSANATVAIPGVHTSANLLLSDFFPELIHKEALLFSAIEEKVASGEYDLGLLIHEGRFTYASKGLLSLYDLGTLWEERTQLPLPLGCICASRQLTQEAQQCISGMILDSILYARSFPMSSTPYILQHANEMDEAVIQQHIELYVNDFSLDLGPEGRSAIRSFLDRGVANGLIPEYQQPVFI